MEGSDPGSLSVPSAAREADGIFISQSEISLKRVARTKSWVDRVTPIFSLVQTFSKNIPPICWSHTHTKKNGGTDENLVTLFFLCYVKELRFGPKEFNIIFFSGLIWHWSNRKVPRRTRAKKKKIIQPPPNPLGGGSALASEPKKFPKKKRVSTKL